MAVTKAVTQGAGASKKVHIARSATPSLHSWDVNISSPWAYYVDDDVCIASVEPAVSTVKRVIDLTQSPEPESGDEDELSP